MYGVVGEKRPTFFESDAFLDNLDEHTLDCYPTTRTLQRIREYPKIGNCPALSACIILHMNRRKKGSFLFLGFPCTLLPPVHM